MRPDTMVRSHTVVSSGSGPASQGDNDCSGVAAHASRGPSRDADLDACRARAFARRARTVRLWWLNHCPTMLEKRFSRNAWGSVVLLHPPLFCRLLNLANRAKEKTENITQALITIIGKDACLTLLGQK
eukprot:SRR837773.19139.p2 GENE.SRR837773.19139~~SRR837773.19139.p2  ORF type:complete len:129 (+),score=8.36 SRR837773.19139:45-431(+)